jgi:hypothetical protein
MADDQRRQWHSSSPQLTTKQQAIPTTIADNFGDRAVPQ